MIELFKTPKCLVSVCVLTLFCFSVPNNGLADEEKTTREELTAWQKKAVEYARIMSHVKWTPVASGMPKREGQFEKGVEYTGVPYSSVKWEGRYIGFEIFLKTFLAAVENPRSVVYTENLFGEITNAECYYGKVCSSYTSYALQCGIWYLSRLHGPESREGVVRVEGQSGLHAEVGDVIYRPPSKPGGGTHIAIVTEVTAGSDGKVSHVRVEESTPETTKDTNHTVAEFDDYLAFKNKELYRITDLDAWRGDNRAESFLFPNYEEDSATPTINRVLLLDRGDWVPYHKGQAVKFNVMDKDAQGVKALVIKRGDEMVETIEMIEKGVVERSFSDCGDYTAHCVMSDGSLSQACEFSVCDLEFNILNEKIVAGEPIEIEMDADNMKAIILYIRGGLNSYVQHNIFVSEQERRDGKVVVPADMIPKAGKMEFWLIGENKYGRLKKRIEFVVEE